MVNDKTNINVHRSNGNVVLEKNAQSIVAENRTNLKIINTASSTRKLMNNIKRRQAECLGHVMRKGRLEHLLTTLRLCRDGLTIPPCFLCSSKRGE